MFSWWNQNLQGPNVLGQDARHTSHTIIHIIHWHGSRNNRHDCTGTTGSPERRGGRVQKSSNLSPTLPATSLSSLWRAVGAIGEKPKPLSHVERTPRTTWGEYSFRCDAVVIQPFFLLSLLQCEKLAYFFLDPLTSENQVHVSGHLADRTMIGTFWLK